MHEINIQQLIAKAEDFKQKGIPWHHHLLTPNCCFNSSGKYRIILENEITKEAFYCDFTDKPMTHLKRLEELFFKSLATQY